MKTVRAFIGIPVPQATYKKLLDQIQIPNKSGIRWTKVENLHLTLAFMGDVPLEVLERLVEAMAREESLISGTGGVQIRCLSIGHFPSRKPKLIATHLEPSDTLLRLKQCLDRLLDRLDIEYDRKPFTPHITLGRFRKAPTLKFSTPVDVSFRATKIILYQSVLTPAGSDYTPLITLPA